MKRAYLVLDLETIADTSLPPPPPKRGGGTSFPAPPYHQVVVMGAALLDEQCHTRRIWVVGEEDGRSERDTLAALVGFLSAQLAREVDVTLVGFNSRGFDLPVIVARCMKHGIPFPWYYANRNVRYRYSAEGHLDLMDHLADFGASRCYGLDLTAKLIGLPGKLDVAGKSVARMIALGEIDRVRGYCLSDVAQTAGVFLRTQLLRGELGIDAYREAMHVLLAAMERDGRLIPTLRGIDRHRLLLLHGPPPPSAPAPILVPPPMLVPPGERAA